MSLSRTAAALTLPLLAATLAVAPAAPASAAAGPDTIALASGSQPEGIAAGPGTTFFAGSRTDGAIYVGDVRTGERTLLVEGVAGTAARGLQLDRRTGLLWVAGDVTDQDGSKTRIVTAYDSRTGELVERYVVPGERFLNDVEVTRDAVYVTDSRSDELVVVACGGVSLLELTGDFPDPAPDAFGANGIRELPGGDLVIVSSSSGDLFRVDPDTGATDRIELAGRDLTSGDGLELRGRTLYVVYGFATDEVAVVRLDGGARSGTVTGVIGDADLDRPTTAALVAGALYVVNGRFSTPPTPTTPYDVVRLPPR